jgi:alcohol dehydrogenase class IV
VAILSFNTKVHFGHGERKQLVLESTKLGIKKPLFVTDKGVRVAGVFAQATETLTGIDEATIFDQTPPNPTEDAAVAGLTAFHANQCDGIIGVGGGATLDLAKAIAVLCGDPAPLWEYCNRNASPRPIINPPPLILMPTTSGSGSEVGRSAVIIFNNGIKAGVGCPTIVSVAICDPELTLTLPKYMTAATGMDALSHCVETFCSPLINPPIDAIALDGLTRLYQNIERAVTDGNDLDARWHMMMGALEGAVCFQKGLGAVHSVSHSLGALGYHHGTLNALMLPHVLALNAATLEDKLPLLCRAMDLPRETDLVDTFVTLNKRLGLPSGLRELGIEPSIFHTISQASLSDNAHKTNPRVLTEDDYLALLAAAW